MFVYEMHMSLKVAQSSKWCFYVHHRDIFSRQSNVIQQLLTQSDKGSNVTVVVVVSSDKSVG